MDELIAFRLSKQALGALDWLRRRMEVDSRSEALRVLIIQSARAQGYPAKLLARLVKGEEGERPTTQDAPEPVPEKVVDISGKDSGK